MSEKIYAANFYYWFIEAIGLFSLFLATMYLLGFIFSLEALITKLNNSIFELFIGTIAFIGLREFDSQHIYLSFSEDQICIKNGVIAGKINGYDCYDLIDINVTNKRYFGFLDVLTLNLSTNVIKLNNLMFPKKDFQNIKENLLIQKGK